MKSSSDPVYSIKNYFVFRFSLAALWLWNGLYCKLLNGVPRHQQIVGAILGDEYASLFTLLIGAFEVLLAIWIVTGLYAYWCDLLQIILILLMNTLEWVLVPDLLLFGRYNLLLALILCLAIYFVCIKGHSEGERKKIKHA